MKVVNKTEISDSLKDIHKNKFMASFRESMLSAGGNPDSYVIKEYGIEKLASMLGPN